MFEIVAHFAEVGLLLGAGIGAWINIGNRITKLETLMELLMEGRQLLKVRER